MGDIGEDTRSPDLQGRVFEGASHKAARLGPLAIAAGGRLHSLLVKAVTKYIMLRVT